MIIAESLSPYIFPFLQSFSLSSATYWLGKDNIFYKLLWFLIYKIILLTLHLNLSQQLYDNECICCSLSHRCQQLLPTLFISWMEVAALYQLWVKHCFVYRFAWWPVTLLNYRSCRTMCIWRTGCYRDWNT
jgi:hypothetical protein